MAQFEADKLVYAQRMIEYEEEKEKNGKASPEVCHIASPTLGIFVY